MGISGLFKRNKEDKFIELLTQQCETTVEGIKLLAACEGIFAETAGGVTVACAKKLIATDRIPRNESVVLCITGHGLKTQEAVSDHIGKPYHIKASIDSFEETLRKEAKVKEEVWQAK